MPLGHVEGHSEYTSTPICDAPAEIDVRPPGEQGMYILSPRTISVKRGPTLISGSLEHFKNALTAISLTPLPIITEVRELHDKNA